MNIEGRPKNTIYINNINEKIKKEELKRSLYMLFSQFGNILEIVALKTIKMRGQAFIVFKDIVSASNAVRSMQGFPFYDKPMRIQYSRKDSEMTLQLRQLSKGLLPEKKKKPDQDKEAKKKKTPKLMGPNPQPAAATIQKEEASVMDAAELETMEQSVEKSPPNKVLFLTNLPTETNEMMLSMLFNQFPGFKEVRLIANRNDIAFIEFETPVQSASARDALQGFKITPEKAMQITFAKR